MKTKQLSTNLIIGTVVTVAASGLLGAVTGGAVGMSYALYGAIIGGIIGGCLTNYTDIPTEVGVILGSIIGSIIGIINAKVQESKNEELNIDNSDYLKGIDCTKKAVLSHITDAVTCGTSLTNCNNLLKGQNEIITCMGEDSNNDVIVT